MIIGFAGKAASGKTTAAKYLKELDANIVILPMAVVLRQEVEGFIRQVGAEDNVPLIYGDQDDKVRVFYVDTQKALKLCPLWTGFVTLNADIQDRPGQTAVTVRRILQWWGTEYRRAQDPDYWTKAWAQKLQEYDLTQTPIIVDDVRFVNELEMIKKQGGIFIKIERPGFDGANNHSSENSLDHYDNWNLVIANDGRLEDFLRQVEKQIVPLLHDDLMTTR
ncbi:hypothetical protein SAMN05660420_02496 [Desulfuromusa kysingii]|uniref:Dephospho-CoA kinase n=1 Tax=Desulfuromusa kysingii TaxID=37625 RepID=A0A1H4C8Z8_9BACT|nr:hypothetical protein [Desulfuromusa kysingii]SEA56823.1 hypothetical protein SAMN05660420_02496 [Desulfuromusa kysingii]